QEINDEVGYRIGDLEQIIYEQDGYMAEIKAAELLEGLGIKQEQHYLPLSTLSGGYKLRVLLAQTLFNDPDILVLDEPTNHLDIISIYWLESYLRERFKGVLLFISHDVAFLNNLSTHIIDIDYGEVRQYTGNYEKFCKQKQQVIDLKMHELQYMQKKIDRMQIIADKFRAGTRATQSKSIEKKIDKLELPDIQKSSRVAPSFNFRPKRSSGKTVLQVKEICKNFDNKNILSNVSFDVARGEKLLIIGQNGVGKSTLLKIILERLKQDAGSVFWGHEVHISYFAQDHYDLLNDSKSIYEWLASQAPLETNEKIRAILGHVLFKQDDVHKNILNISGGEGARLLLAKIMLDSPNILVLDEPTNHMDIETKEALQKALIEYEGTVILVSHDRDFASKIASRIISLSSNAMIDFRGSYDEYLERYGNDYLSSEWLISSSAKS
ncbi:MAG: ABC-F family ATP-binding cassette domain-containing protein, partial [Rickettsiaceae bacterium]|nr:ABC-F family ATP-binding cassette domain-containing protein [Rickettsiaceae bacterium]